MAASASYSYSERSIFDVKTLIEALRFDKKKNTFVETYLPNHEIGIVHLAGKNNDHIRNNKNFISKVRTLEGDIIEKSLRFRN